MKPIRALKIQPVPLNSQHFRPQEFQELYYGLSIQAADGLDNVILYVWWSREWWRLYVWHQLGQPPTWVQVFYSMNAPLMYWGKGELLNLQETDDDEVVMLDERTFSLWRLWYCWRHLLHRLCQFYWVFYQAVSEEEPLLFWVLDICLLVWFYLDSWSIFKILNQLSDTVASKIEWFICIPINVLLGFLSVCVCVCC